MASGVPSESAKIQEQANASSATFASHNIRNTNINTAPGVDLSDQQKVLVGSILDLFEGNPTLKHLSLWSKTATFADNITIATGYDKFAAQWYGLPAVFKPIQIQRHQVVSAGNPIELDLSNKYTVKGIKKEQVMDSRVKIHVGADGKIEKVEDRWNDNLPEGGISEVSSRVLVLPLTAARALVGLGAGVVWWAFCTVSWSWPFAAFRKLNAVTVPTMVKVPKNEEEDKKMQAERDQSS
ncbi:hypothetical protein PFICI_06686 [Pestalotiopsis fici W106-1]|uniref:Uncharacterized protein n=1 Tax=Pestalotiopsis fici (strain W106-1 / CGMCC3.15140) TaxID=1229662 RepID=W3X6L5_PESFW|nr:uncharacterized protein PFICI_06686 [Pestalotiopsis fici W106-1]ETS81684.1 hypothetical protein PFICI_06686 [Pestalotiopsis fici W106-1]